MKDQAQGMDNNWPDAVRRDRQLISRLRHPFWVFSGFLAFFGLFFSPVLFTGRLLAPGEGLAFYLQNLYGPRALWTDLMFAGYPTAADPQMMSWYPLAMLFTHFPGGWNLFVLLAYVLAAGFTYGYAYSLTTSRWAATVAGLIYGMSGFMMGHLGHVTMIHTAAWIPLLLWGLECLRHRVSAWWMGITIGATAGCILGGHSQISVYALSLAVLYVLVFGWVAPIGRWRYYRRSMLVLLLGILVCSIQILPTIEFARLSNRSSMSFEEFTSGSIPLAQLLQYFFPYFFGGPFAFWNIADPPYQLPYWGKANLAEITGYVGWLPLLLSVIGIQSRGQSRRMIGFWVAVAVISTFVSLGKDGWLSYVIYQLPIYNKFRCSGRAVLLVALAVSVLSSFGIKAIEVRWVTQRRVAQTIFISAALGFIGFWGFWQYHQPIFQAAAAKVGIQSLSVWPWQNPAIGYPLITASLAIGSLWLWNQQRRRWLRVFLIISLMGDLANFGWFWEWQVLSPPQSAVLPNAIAQTYRPLLVAHHQRFLAADVDNIAGFESLQKLSQNSPSELKRQIMFPHLNRLWQVPAVDGYSALILSRFSQLMQIQSGGGIAKNFSQSLGRELDLMAVRYLRVPQRAKIPSQPGLVWSQQDLGLSLGGNDCRLPQTQLASTIDVTDLRPLTTAIGLVTTMGCAAQVPQQADVVQVVITNTNGQTERHTLKAGRDTAEQTHECQDSAAVRHQKPASIFRSALNRRSGFPDCNVHEYQTSLALNQPQRIQKIQLKWLNQPGFILINRISLMQQEANRSLTSLPIKSLMVNPHWRIVSQTETDIIYENQRAMPRTWLVAETMPLTAEQILTAIRTSKLPDGRIYAPRQMALVEDPKALIVPVTLQPLDRADIIKIEPTHVQIQTQTIAPRFLVLSDVFYPGWLATIDGKPTKIFQTNYVQRGVQVPSGKHLVEYRFEPMSFKLGAGITLSALFGGVYGLWRINLSRRTNAV